jgi:hypothetical protein
MERMPEDRDRIRRDERDVRTRVVMDGEGTEWVVHEVETPQPWARGARCLIFSSASIVRRVWSYPAGWARLSSRELLQLVEESHPFE